MKIALAQLNYTIGDFNGNAQKIIHSIQQARQNNASLIVFSELSVCGYPPDDLLDYPHFINQCIDSLNQIAEHTTGITAIVGCPTLNKEEKGRRLMNSACVLTNGKWVNTISKTLLPTYDVFSEARYFQSNEVFNCIDINGIKMAITICEDLWDEMDFFSYKQDPLKLLSQHQPQLIINLSASPYNSGKEKTRFEILKKQCLQFDLPMVYVNQVGAHTDLIFDGNSYFINKDGSIGLELPPFQESLQYIDTTLANTSQENYYEDRIEGLYNALVFGIKDYFLKMNFKTVVLGSSGGIDSALVQTLASHAIGAENVTAILMPSKFSSDGSVIDAELLSKKLNNNYHVIPIKEVYDSFEKTLDQVFKGLQFDVTEENIQARSRAVILMAYSNKKGNILLNTSNKSEMAVGYSTLYGDMCGSLSVIGDVYKTDVYQLVNYINKDQEIIPWNIINKPPSAELRPNQKDSDSLPEYSILDGILKLYIEDCKSLQDIIELGYDPMVVEKVIKLVNRNEYKRFQAPPILRVSSKAFGRGRVIPLVAKW